MTVMELLAELRSALWAEHLTGLPLLKPYRDRYIRELDAAMTMQPMPLSAKEKQAAFRQRQAEQGLQEVRGIFLPPDLHAELKAIAAKLLTKHQKASRKFPAETGDSPC